MNDTYLQDFGTRRSMHRSKPKTDPMAASGRWDDLYLRASKPRLRKTHRRDSMRKETKVYLAPGSKPLHFTPNGEVGHLLGFTCDNSKYKYRLDSPSYPARHRELSLEDRKPQKLQKVIPTDWRDVYTSLRAMVHKIRVRDRKMTRLLVRDFALLWPLRHQLAKSINARVDKPVGFTDAPAPKPVIAQAPVVKASKPANFRVLAFEYRANLTELAKLSAINDEVMTKAQTARRVELSARQRELFRMIGRWM